MGRIASMDVPTARPVGRRKARGTAGPIVAEEGGGTRLALFETAPVALAAPAPVSFPPATLGTITPTAVAKPRLKSGYGLWTRAAEGDDNMMPFRSLDDLLSAIKPILRASAGSPEAVWFSIQPVDLADIDIETL
jgi:hypothetical protein